MLAVGACVVRPPGHHAKSDTTKGYCIFNNIVVVAHILVHKEKELGVEEVLRNCFNNCCSRRGLGNKV